ncbi:hypothetical protein BW727_200008 (plasmid) [Jeotgalibaca dankookensis]|uniref:Uncharacterized protein n=1 Tax=Jeotgalibaca dankookensis TaxID=708126 RepID=A0A1S6IS78_9LACT|nr:hypothetical protein [Jeotgalibaca dankookensis]AQS54411.1 hypothetical protein BW727_200008 [Jeotgalibaca dankookensis]
MNYDSNKTGIDSNGLGLAVAFFILGVFLWLNSDFLLYEILNINLAKIFFLLSIAFLGQTTKNEKKKDIFSDISVGMFFIGTFVAWVGSTNVISNQFFLIVSRVFFLGLLLLGVFGTISGFSEHVNSLYNNVSPNKIEKHKDNSEVKINNRQINKKELFNFLFQLVGAAASVASIYQIVSTT